MYYKPKTKNKSKEHKIMNCVLYNIMKKITK